MKKLIQKRQLIPLIASLAVAVCVVTAVCVFAEKEEISMNENSETGETANEPIIELVSEPESEPVTEPESESVSESESEPETELPTEAPTEVPTEPQTEPPTEVVIDYSILKRDTALVGEEIDFTLGWSGGAELGDDDRVIAAYSSELSASLVRKIRVIRSHEEMESTLYETQYYDVGHCDNYEYLDKYDESFFADNAVIILTSSGDDTIIDDSLFLTKDVSEISLGFDLLIDNRKGARPCITIYNSKIIEVSKADLVGVDTISFFARDRFNMIVE